MSNIPQPGEQENPVLVKSPFWGKVKPLSEHEYTDRDGNTLFYVGAYRYGSKLEWTPIFWNGIEWVKRLPKICQDFSPLYNIMGLFGDGLTGDLSKTVIIVQSPLHADTLNQHLTNNKMSMVAVSWYGGLKGIKILDVEPLRNRDVVLWSDKNSESELLFESLASAVSPVVNTISRAEPEEFRPFNWGPIDAVAERDVNFLTPFISGASRVDKVEPRTVLNESGIGNLEGFLPDMFIRQMIDNFGVFSPSGHKKIPATYQGCMDIVNNDPAFKDFMKYDMGTASIVWDQRAYPTIDDLKNAILRRLTSYGVSPSRALRDDIVDSLASQPERRINMIKDFFDSLCMKYPDASAEDLNTLLSHIKFKPDQSGVPFQYQFAKRTFEIFFTKAALRIYTSATEKPYTNDCVPVLIGKQGKGKGRFARYLAMGSETDKWFVDLGNKSPTWGSPDWIRLIVGKFIAELGEMQTLRKDEINTIKSGISETVDTYTPKHKEGTKVFPRTVSFFGTGNDPEFLRDTTGNRRFYPFMIEEIDHIKLYANPTIIERVWSYFFQIARSISDISEDTAMEGLNIQATRDFLFKTFTSESPEYFAYMESVRSGSMDLGITGEIVREAIEKIEGVVWTSPGRNKYITIEPLDVAREVYGDRYASTPMDFKNKMKYWFTKFGYTYEPAKIDGYTRRAWRLYIGDKGLHERMRERESSTIGSDEKVKL